MNLNALCFMNTIMPYLVDIVLVAILALFMFVCAKKGFITCLFGFISTIAAVVLAFSFAGLAAEITGGLFGMESALSEGLTAAFSTFTGFDVVPDPSVPLVDQLMSGDMSQMIANMIAENFETIPEGYTLGRLAGETVAEFAVILVSGIALFFIFKIVFVILKKFFNFIARDGLLGGLNRLLGAAVGLVEGLLVLCVAVSIMALFPDLMTFINSSLIMKFLLETNLLVVLITLVMTAF